MVFSGPHTTTDLLCDPRSGTAPLEALVPQSAHCTRSGLSYFFNLKNAFKPWLA